MSFFSYRRGECDGDVCVSGACVCKKRDVRVRYFRVIRAIGFVLNRSRDRVWNCVFAGRWDKIGCQHVSLYISQIRDFLLQFRFEISSKPP